MLLQFIVDAGTTPHQVYKDFDSKLLEGEVLIWFHENCCKLLHASPLGWQSQNGFFEHVWQMVIAMAWSYIITDIQMPHEYWYWAVHHAIQVSNYLPSTVNGVVTTSTEVVHRVKPDYHVLFHLFSTGFHHTHDSIHARDHFEAKMIQGIVIGHCCQSDGLLFYSPHMQQIYHSSDYKLDEGHSMPNTFNLLYDGGIFVGLYDNGPPSLGTEPYPEGTTIVWPLHQNDNTIKMHGTVISVPLLSTLMQLPSSSADEPPYTIQLIDGSTIHASLLPLHS